MREYIQKIVIVMVVAVLTFVLILGYKFFSSPAFEADLMGNSDVEEVLEQDNTVVTGQTVYMKIGDIEDNGVIKYYQEGNVSYVNVGSLSTKENEYNYFRISKIQSVGDTWIVGYKVIK